MAKKKWKRVITPKNDALKKTTSKLNLLENIDLNDEKKLSEGLKYLTDLIEKKVALQDVVGIKDSELNAIIATGVLLYQESRLKEAEDLLRGAVLLNNHNALAHSALGTVLMAQGKDDEAIIELTEAINIDSTDIAAYVNRGEVYLKQADFQLASEDLRKSIELDPEQIDPAANRARAIVIAINEKIKDLQSQVEQGQEPVL